MTSRACVFINSNDPKIRNQLINTISFIKPKFPPSVDLLKLITKQTFTDSSRSSGRAPNAFIIYRKAFVEAARKDGYQLPMTVISSMASRSWDLEPDLVKEEYKRLAKEANAIRNKLIPKLSRRRKREKWNIVSFPPSPASNINSSSSSSVINKSKLIAKEKKLEVKEVPSSPPVPPYENPEITFHIPYDITSPIVDRFLDDSTFDNLYPSPNFSLTTNSAQQQQQQQQQQQHEFNNRILQSSVEPNTLFYNQESIIEEQIVDTFNAAVDISTGISTGYINNEFEYDSPGFLTLFNDYGISYPSFWVEF